MSKKTKLITKTDMERLLNILNEFVRDREMAAQFDELLASLEIVDPANTPSDLVTMNSMIRGLIKSNDKKADELRTLTLVYPHRFTSIRDGCISVLTPLGKELLGARVGEAINWLGHDGSIRKMILSEVVYQPEANGDWHL